MDQCYLLICHQKYSAILDGKIPENYRIGHPLNEYAGELASFLQCCSRNKAANYVFFLAMRSEIGCALSCMCSSDIMINSMSGPKFDVGRVNK